MRTPSKAALVVAFALITTGCTSSSTDAASPSTESAAQETRSAEASTSPETAPAESTPPAAAELSDVEPQPEPTVEGDTVAIAVAATTAFCQPALDYDTWIAELYPFLSQQAAVAYETVDPANVPCTTLTGAASVRDGDGAFTMRILVPTDAGEYSVYVHRAVETGPWAVEQITPLASE